MDAGADIDAVDNHRRTALIVASQNNQVEVMELLLRAGADEDCCDDQRQTALYWACFHGIIDAVDYLADESEVLDMMTSCGHSPMLVCCQLGHVECVELLLRYGARANAGPEIKEEAEDEHIKEKPHNSLHPEATPGNTSSTLEESRDLNALPACSHGRVSASSGRYTTSTVLLAAQHGHVEICRKLLSVGADPEVRDDMGATVLYHLIPYPDCVALLLDSLVDANGVLHSDKEGFAKYALRNEFQPIHRAVVENHSQSLRLLLQANCSLSHGGNTQCRLKLPDAIVKGMLETAKVLYIYSVITGCNLHWLELYLKSRPLQTLCNIRPKVAVVRNWMLTKSRTFTLQLSLMKMCRNAIRVAMPSRGFKGNVQLLPLPTAMQQFIQLKELDDYDV